jgi:hypothetical protein
MTKNWLTSCIKRDQRTEQEIESAKNIRKFSRDKSGHDFDEQENNRFFFWYFVPLMSRMIMDGQLSIVEMRMIRGLTVKDKFYIVFILMFSPYGIRDICPVFLISIFMTNMATTYHIANFVVCWFNLLMFPFVYTRIPESKYALILNMMKFSLMSLRSIVFIYFLKWIPDVFIKFKLTFKMNPVVAGALFFVFLGYFTMLNCLMPFNSFTEKLPILCCPLNFLFDRLKGCTQSVIRFMECLSVLINKILDTSDGLSFEEIVKIDSKHVAQMMKLLKEIKMGQEVLQDTPDIELKQQPESSDRSTGVPL